MPFGADGGRPCQSNRHGGAELAAPLQLEPPDLLEDLAPDCGEGGRILVATGLATLESRQSEPLAAPWSEMTPLEGELMAE